MNPSHRILLVLLIAVYPAAASAGALSRQSAALDGVRPRVLVSTDIGGSDPDDFQSMVHLLLYADVLDIEGLVSSPWGPGRREHVLEVIDRYERDYPNLRTYSERYPAPDALRALAKEGAINPALGSGVTRSTPGSDWIIRCARRDDPRPLWVLVWGTIDDLAQALHDDPSIKPKLRVHYISSSNKKWGIAAYDFIERNHPDLWIIENNSTYRGWFEGGNQDGDLGNTSFIATHAKGHGALGDYLAGLLGGRIKMGDTPSVAYLLKGTPEDPAQPSWGGRYVRAWARPKRVFERGTTATDEIEAFGILEITLPNPTATSAPGSPTASPAAAAFVVDNQEFPAFRDDSGRFVFRFMPREAKRWSYRIKSNLSELDGLRGEFTSFLPTPAQAANPSARYAHWWTDDPDPKWSQGAYQGAKLVNEWREAFLKDFAARLDRCRTPAAK